MSEDGRMLDKHEATVSDALSLLKRTCRKLSKVTLHHISITVPAESLLKIARSIDPSSRIYPEPVGNFIMFVGVAIISEESGDDGRREAAAWLKERFRDEVDRWKQPDGSIRSDGI